MKITKTQLKQIIKEELEAALSESKNNSIKFKDIDLSKVKKKDLIRMLGNNNVAFGELTGAELDKFDLWSDEQHERVTAIEGTAELYAINRDIRVALSKKPERPAGTDIFGV
tara:strand:+ start:867 stop:1202 length:336 start_codon:yes stop_codon:yes gene_type:complete